MQPTMTMTDTATEAGADAPNDLDVMLAYSILSDENKERVNLYVQTLLEAQCTPEP